MTFISTTREETGGVHMPEPNRRPPEPGDGLHRIGCFQNTGVGWWNEGGGVAQTLRTPCGGDSTKANLIVFAIPDHDRSASAGRLQRTEQAVCGAEQTHYPALRSATDS